MNHLITFEGYNGANLATNDNPFSFQWFGGDISASPELDTPKSDKPVAPTFGRKRMQLKRLKDEREKDNKEKTKQSKIEYMTGFNTTDDIAKHLTLRKPGVSGTATP